MDKTINCPKCSSPNTQRRSWLERFEAGQLNKYLRVFCKDCGKNSVTNIPFEKLPANAVTCCPWRSHYAKGLCYWCYDAKRAEAKRARKKELP